MFWRCNYHHIWVQDITFIPNLGHSPYSGMLLLRQSVCAIEHNRIVLPQSVQKFFLKILLKKKKKVSHMKRAANGGPSKWRNQSSLSIAYNIHYKHKRPEVVKHGLLQLFFYLYCLQAFHLPISHLFTYLYFVPKTKPQKHI